MPVLKSLTGKTSGQVFPLDRDTTVLGRERTCDVVLDDKTVGRRNAQIVRSGNSYLIEDLGSRLSTRVNSQVLIESRVLLDGDEIEVGASRFLYCEESTAIEGSLDVSPAEATQSGSDDPEAKL